MRVIVSQQKSDSVIVEEARSVEALLDHVGEDLRNALLEMGAEQQADSLNEEKIVILMEIAELIERSREDKLSALRNVPKKKLFEETAKVAKLLSKFKTHSITNTNELFYTGATVVTNRLGIKIDKVAWRKEPMWNRTLKNKIKDLMKDVSQLEASKDKDTSNFKRWVGQDQKENIKLE